MAWRRLLMAILFLLGGIGGAWAQAGDPAGRWALMAGERPIAILELERDARTGGWTGAWTRPEHLSITQSHAVVNISGPVVRRRIVSAVAREGGLDFTIEGRPGGPAGRHTFRLIGPDHAEFGWIDPLAIPPVPLVRALPGAKVAEDWDEDRTYAITTPQPTNAEMTALFAADQAARRGEAVDWAAVGRDDVVRRERTRALLATGALRSGTDFFHAAFIFQHGDKPDDYLLAHTLAVVATARGRSDATWIAAATLDRYLMSIKRPQIFGTQFQTAPGEATSQEPYDRALVSDALRQALGVPPLAQQEAMRVQIEAEIRAREAAEKK